MVESMNKNFRPSIGSLPISIEQKGTSIIIHWDQTRKTTNFTSQDPENQAVLIRYARSDTSSLREKAEEGLFINGAMNLTGKFDAVNIKFFFVIGYKFYYLIIRNLFCLEEFKSKM
ncbi:unnamed protein product [Onchocerca flexuosa]|uniref:Fibronectin type-III domain-containing protein n=1 Tax=Onchocerca flexuosa TaxID=387005 RepID=A0A183HP44_9BILA|nr:unnamed protein product [Onchocerca flexuosa]